MPPMPVSSTRPMATSAYRPIKLAWMIQNCGVGSRGNITTANSRMRERIFFCDCMMFIADLFLIFVMRRRDERTPQQYRQQRHEDDHFLVVAGPEGAEGFQQTDEHRTTRRQWKTGQSADGGGDKTFEADQKPGVVKNGAHRPDQHARQCADEGRNGKAD